MKTSVKDDIKVISGFGWNNDLTAKYLRMSTHTLEDASHRNRPETNLGRTPMRKVPFFRHFLEDISKGGLRPTKKIVDSITIMPGMDFSSFIEQYYAKEEKLVIGIIDLSVEKFLARRRVVDYVEEFKSRFGGVVGEASITEAAVKDPQFLSEFIAHGQMNNTTRAIALSKLGLALDESLLGFIKAYAKDPSSLVREGAFQGLAEYYFDDEKKYSHLLAFFKSSLREEKAEGVQKQIANLIRAMEDFIE